jgi:hypothetical protein
MPPSTTAISYSLPVGGTLEQVTVGDGSLVPLAVPLAAGTVTIVIDQSPTAIIDVQSPTGTRAPKSGEILSLLVTLQEYFSRDPNINR